MVGHYWLRHPELAPRPEIRLEIEQTLIQIQEFARNVHSGKIKCANNKVSSVLVIGIGGSALGPQFVSNVLARPGHDPVDVHFFDNADPDGMDRALAGLGDRLKTTLAIVISKSGGTKETRNGMLEAKAAFERAGLRFAAHAVAITGVGSELDQLAAKEGWLRRFPMWDWVGGAGKKAAKTVLDMQLAGLDFLRSRPGQVFAPEALAKEIGQPDKAEMIYHICEHLSANSDYGIRKTRDGKPGEGEYGSH